MSEDLKSHEETAYLMAGPRNAANAWEDYLYWRRIDRWHRLVYKATEETVYIVQCRYHY